MAYRSAWDLAVSGWGDFGSESWMRSMSYWFIWWKDQNNRVGHFKKVTSLPPVVFYHIFARCSTTSAKTSTPENWRSSPYWRMAIPCPTGWPATLKSSTGSIPISILNSSPCRANSGRNWSGNCPINGKFRSTLCSLALRETTFRIGSRSWGACVWSFECAFYTCLRGWGFLPLRFYLRRLCVCS